MPGKPPRGKRTLPERQLTLASLRKAVDFLATAEECIRLQSAYVSVKCGKPCGPDQQYLGVVQEALESLPHAAELAKEHSAHALAHMLKGAFARLQEHVRANQKGYGDQLRRDLLRYRLQQEFDRAVGKTRTLKTRTSKGLTTVVSETKWTATALREHLAGTFQLANESSVRRLLGRPKGRR